MPKWRKVDFLVFTRRYIGVRAISFWPWHKGQVITWSKSANAKCKSLKK